MKRLLLLFGIMLIAFNTSAQPDRFQHERFHPERMRDDDIIKMQTRDIVNWLDLNETTEKRFVNEYTAFRKEIDKIAKQAKPAGKNDSESEIDKAIQRNFEISEQILQIRKKYYLRFKEFLTPSQIQEMYHIENEAGRRRHHGPEEPCDRPMM